MILVEVNGKDYIGTQVKLSTGETFTYADKELAEEKPGIKEDERIADFLEACDLVELDRLTERMPTDKEIIDFCNSKEIYIGRHTKGFKVGEGTHLIYFGALNKTDLVDEMFRKGKPRQEIVDFCFQNKINIAEYSKEGKFLNQSKW